MLNILDHNFNLHATRIPRLTAGIEVVQRPGLTCIDSGLSCDTFNIIHLTDTGQFQAADLKLILDHFRNKQFAYCLWINREQLSPEVAYLFNELRLTRQNAEPGMVLDLNHYREITHPLHASIRLARTEDDVRQFADIIARNWDPPDEHVRQYYARTAAHYLDPENQIRLALCYEGNTPAGVVEIFASDRETIGLYGLATLLSFRGRGIGNALMTYALNLALRDGYQQAILQASEDGIGIYERLGFREITTFYEYA
ncbi:MAG: GNAT family N-acetyltransferase [Saprospiraceae bacterium]|nr:GNAT family N-acetyltransferase [Lewinella sp.]